MLHPEAPPTASTPTAPSQESRDPATWLTSVRARIARDQASARVEDHAAGLRHDGLGLALEVDDDGTTWLGGAEDAGVELRTARLRQGSATLDVAAPDIHPGACRRGEHEDCVRRLELDSAAVLTWWEHQPEGLEQGWTVAAPLGAGDLRVEVTTSTPAFVEGGGLRLGMEGSGLKADGLRAWDATGRALPAWIEATDDGFAVSVDDDGATFPVTIDPMWTPWGWAKVGSQGDTAFGAAVALGGDVNGDGYEDALVGAPGFDLGRRVDVGRVYLFLGGPQGLATSASQTFDGGSSEEFGTAVAFLGDVNGDGREDAAFGAAGYDGGIRNQGAAYVFYGTGAGLQPAAAVRVTGGAADRRYGGALDAAGDTNGDGYGDLVVGVARDGTTDGLVRLFLGGPAGIQAPPAQTWGRNQGVARYGQSVVGIGDLDGDGFDDVAVGAPRTRGAEPAQHVGVHVFFGGPGGPGAAPDWSVSDYGHSVTAGDVDGDGAPDLLSTNGYDSVVTWRGGARALGAGSAFTSPVHAGIRTLASGGDLDQDGYDDALVAHIDSFRRASDLDGYVYFHRGGPTGLSAQPTSMWRGESRSYTFGHAMALGDVDADAYDDALVGAPGESYEEDSGGQYTARARGRAFLLPGGPGGPEALHGAPLPTLVQLIQQPLNFYHPLDMTAAGDVDGDGVSELVVLDSGAAVRAFDAAGAEVSVSPPPTRPVAAHQLDLCDVNGDGFADAVASGWTATEEFLLFTPGGAGGLGTTSALLSTPGNRGNGFVACAGDLNVDGYEDLAYRPNPGMLQLLYGGPAGPTPSGIYPEVAVGVGTRSELVVATDSNGDGTPDLVIADPDAPSGAIGEWFAGPGGPTAAPDRIVTGTSYRNADVPALKALGDINGDGYGDIAQVAYTMQWEVRLFLWLGGPAGYTALPQVTLHDPSGARAPFRVSGLGDVNGDGTDELGIAWGLLRSPSSGFASLLEVHTASLGARPWWQGPWGLAPLDLLAAGDLNGDGWADAFALDQDPVERTSQLYVLYGGPLGMDAPVY